MSEDPRSRICRMRSDPYNFYNELIRDVQRTDICPKGRGSHFLNDNEPFWAKSQYIIYLCVEALNVLRDANVPVPTSAFCLYGNMFFSWENGDTPDAHLELGMDEGKRDEGHEDCPHWAMFESDIEDVEFWGKTTTETLLWLVNRNWNAGPARHRTAPPPVRS